MLSLFLCVPVGRGASCKKCRPICDRTSWRRLSYNRNEAQVRPPRLILRVPRLEHQAEAAQGQFESTKSHNLSDLALHFVAEVGELGAAIKRWGAGSPWTTSKPRSVTRPPRSTSLRQRSGSTRDHDRGVKRRVAQVRFEDAAGVMGSRQEKGAAR